MSERIKEQIVPFPHFDQSALEVDPMAWMDPSPEEVAEIEYTFNNCAGFDDGTLFLRAFYAPTTIPSKSASSQ